MVSRDLSPFELAEQLLSNKPQLVALASVALKEDIARDAWERGNVGVYPFMIQELYYGHFLRCEKGREEKVEGRERRWEF